MNSNRGTTLGERDISYIVKRAPEYPSAPLVSILLAVLFAVSTVLGLYKIEVPISVFGLLASLFGALLWYERLQLSRMILERDRKIARLVRE